MILSLNLTSIFRIFRQSPVFVIAAMLVFVFTSSACDPPEWSDESDFRVELASYEQGEFLSLDDSNNERGFIMERGFQGGQHVNILVLAEDLDTDVDYQVLVWLDSADSSFGNREETIYFGSYDDDIDGMHVAFQRFQTSPRVIEEEVTARVQIMLPDGRVGRGTATATVRWSEFDEENTPRDGEEDDM